MTRREFGLQVPTVLRSGALLSVVLVALTGCAKHEKQQQAHGPAINLTRFAEQTQRLWDVHEVANLMGLYVHYNRTGLDTDTVGLFAIDDPDVAAEYPGEGRFIGKAEVAKRLTWNERMQQAGKPEFYGRFMEHMLVSPIIVVADDGLTAKAIWSQPGYEAVNISNDPHQPKVMPLTLLGKYAVDFKKVGTQWKIWHLHIYPTFVAAHGARWTDAGKFTAPKSSTTIAEAASAMQLPNKQERGLTPPHATQDNGPFWSYTAAQPHPSREEPKAPLPYATWTATFSY